MRVISETDRSRAYLACRVNIRRLFQIEVHPTCCAKWFHGSLDVAPRRRVLDLASLSITTEFHLSKHVGERDSSCYWIFRINRPSLQFSIINSVYLGICLNNRNLFQIAIFKYYFISNIENFSILEVSRE